MELETCLKLQGGSLKQLDASHAGQYRDWPERMRSWEILWWPGGRKRRNDTARHHVCRSQRENHQKNVFGIESRHNSSTQRPAPTNATNATNANCDVKSHSAIVLVKVKTHEKRSLFHQFGRVLGASIYFSGAKTRTMRGQNKSK